MHEIILLGEECSYCSEPDESESEGLEGDSAWEPFTILNPASDRGDNIEL